MMCMSCVLACRMNAAGISDAREIRNGQKPIQRLKVTFSQGTPWVWKCQQCRSAPCEEACFTGGLRRESETERVTQNREICVGCGSCLLACPIDGIRSQEGDHRPAKCDLCQGQEIPACVAVCLSQALVYVDDRRFARERQKTYVKHIKGFP